MFQESPVRKVYQDCPDVKVIVGNRENREIREQLDHPVFQVYKVQWVNQGVKVLLEFRE